MAKGKKRKDGAKGVRPGKIPAKHQQPSTYLIPVPGSTVLVVDARLPRAELLSLLDVLLRKAA